MKSLYKNGYFLEPQMKGSLSTSMLGGAYHLSGALSPNSGKPLLQLASIYVADGVLECKGWKFPRIQLLYSWTCAICEGAFSYRYSESGINIIKYVSGDAYSDFPYENYPETFGEVPLDLVPITPEEQVIIEKINSAPTDLCLDLSVQFPNLSVPRHQVGGIPYLLIGDLLNTHCPCCTKEMSFFATIGNNSFSDPRGFTGNNFVQLVFEICPECNVISVNNFSD